MAETMGKLKNQQFIRLADQHQAMLDALDDEVGSLEPIDRSKLIRYVIEFGDQRRSDVAAYIREELKRARALAKEQKAKKGAGA